jgi:antitoxin HicB
MDDATLARLVLERMSLPYHRVVRGDALEGFVAEVAELPGCMTGAATAREAFEQLDEAMALWLEVAILDGDPIPAPARALTPVA